MNAKELAVAAIALVPCAICTAGAVYMATHGFSGWGWFLFLAVVLYPNVRTGKSAEIHAQRELEESRRNAAP